MGISAQTTATTTTSFSWAAKDIFCELSEMVRRATKEDMGTNGIQQSSGHISLSVNHVARSNVAHFQKAQRFGQK